MESRAKESQEMLEKVSNEDFEKENVEKEMICKMVKDFTEGAFSDKVIAEKVHRVFHLKSSSDKSEMWKVKKALSYLGVLEKKKPSNHKKLKKEDPDKLMGELLQE